MERRAAPQLESARTPAAAAGDDAAKDVYECRICGYKAPGVTCLSQHLHAAHPVTSLRESSALGSDGRDAPEEEERGGGAADAETPCLNDELSPRRSPVKKPVTPEGSESSSLQTAEDSNETSSSLETQEEEKMVSSVPKATQNSSPVLPQEKSPSSSEPKQASHKRHMVSGTSTHNKPNLVCLPLVSEGLKLVWVRSEQIHELDEVSDLVEAFNAFPYPTSQESSALARKCALPAERVKTWFMMQRVRYGISWGDDDIQETRRKLRNIQRRTVAEERMEVSDEERMEVSDEERELQNDLAAERRSLGEMLPVFKQRPETEAHKDQRDQTHQPGRTFPQHTNQHRFDVSQNNITSQSNHHVHQLLSSTAVYNNCFEPVSPVSQMNLQFHSGSRNVHPHNSGMQGFDALGQLPYMIVNDQQTATPFHSERHPLPKSLRILPGKKSKAQLMALRRSFVRKSWPSDTEVQRLQKSTGLSRHEIRKWFADSRYQLRRNGRAWLAKLAKHNLLHEAQQNSLNSQQENDVLPDGSFHSNNEANNREAQFEVDVGVDNDEGAVNQSNETKQETSDGEFEDSKSFVQQYLADRSTPPPLSFPHGRVEPNVRLRKKTREQLEMLRQSFLCCQWPTNDDYFLLQQKTGLTRTEIIQWFGDTRYHVKHNQIRWMTSQERERIRAVVTQQQKMGGKYARGKFLLEGAGSRVGSENSALVNGSGSSKCVTDNEPFMGGASVLPEGEL